ncbi:MAG: hypothetical protein U0414_15190 [Polyangiaceae bacterium]
MHTIMERSSANPARAAPLASGASGAVSQPTQLEKFRASLAAGMTRGSAVDAITLSPSVGHVAINPQR